MVKYKFIHSDKDRGFMSVLSVMATYLMIMIIIHAKNTYAVYCIFKFNENLGAYILTALYLQVTDLPVTDRRDEETWVGTEKMRTDQTGLTTTCYQGFPNKQLY